MSTTETLIAPAGTWQLDPVHSSVGFEVAYLSGTFKGHFREFDGTLAVEGEKATLEGSAKVSSVDVKDENLAAHLQSPTSSTPSSIPRSGSPRATSRSTGRTSGSTAS